MMNDEVKTSNEFTIKQTFHLATKEGNIDVLIAIIDKGLDIDSKDKEGNTCL